MKKIFTMVIGLVIAMSAIFAQDNRDEVAALKASVAKMQAAMNQRDLQLDTLQNELNAIKMNDMASAGGEPTKLQSANGKATIRIGGEVRSRYVMGWANGYNRTAPDGSQNSNFKSQYAGWALQRAQLTFDFDLSKDTTARLALRVCGGGNGVFQNGGQILNEAWWAWNNIGGSNLNLSVGYQYMPFGMGNNFNAGAYGWVSTNSGIITVPFVLFEEGNEIFNRNMGDRTQRIYDRDLTTTGILTSYRAFDEQVILKAGVFSSVTSVARFVGNNPWNNNPGVNTANENRNIGLINHVVNVSYNPDWFTGLHLEAAYMGQFDEGMGFNGFSTSPELAGYDAVGAHGEHTYRPSFDFGAFYTIGKWKFFGEYVMTLNPTYRDGFGVAFSAGADYSFSKKIMFSGEFDYAHYTNYSDGSAITAGGLLMNTYDAYRLSAGIKYDFDNGLILQAQYLHDFIRVFGVNDSNWKDNDAILLQSTYRF